MCALHTSTMVSPGPKYLCYAHAQKFGKIPQAKRSHILVLFTSYNRDAKKSFTHAQFYWFLVAGVHLARVSWKRLIGVPA